MEAGATFALASVGSALTAVVAAVASMRFNRETERHRFDRAIGQVHRSIDALSARLDAARPASDPGAEKEGP